MTGQNACHHPAPDFRQYSYITTVVAPFEYGAIVYATILGIIFWGEYPDIWSLTGVLILVGAGLYIWRREVMLAGRR